MHDITFDCIRLHYDDYAPALLLLHSIVAFDDDDGCLLAHSEQHNNKSFGLMDPRERMQKTALKWCPPRSVLLLSVGYLLW